MVDCDPVGFGCIQVGNRHFATTLRNSDAPDFRDAGGLCENCAFPTMPTLASNEEC